MTGAAACENCGAAGRPMTMSRFDTAWLCVDCDRAERLLPEWKEAAEAEQAAVLGGNYNFPGVGFPGGRTPRGER